MNMSSDNIFEPLPFKKDKDGKINIKEIKRKDIYKNDKWWKTVALVEVNGDYGIKKQVQVYLWMKNKKGYWEEKQKYSESKLAQWDAVVEAVDELIKEIQ